MITLRGTGISLNLLTYTGWFIVTLLVRDADHPCSALLPGHFVASSGWADHLHPVAVWWSKGPFTSRPTICWGIAFANLNLDWRSWIMTIWLVKLNFIWKEAQIWNELTSLLFIQSVTPYSLVSIKYWLNYLQPTGGRPHKIKHSDTHKLEIKSILYS